jgi:hypothetical protein
MRGVLIVAASAIDPAFGRHRRVTARDLGHFAERMRPDAEVRGSESGAPRNTSVK